MGGVELAPVTPETRSRGGKHPEEATQGASQAASHFLAGQGATRADAQSSKTRGRTETATRPPEMQAAERLYTAHREGPGLKQSRGTSVKGVPRWRTAAVFTQATAPAPLDLKPNHVLITKHGGERDGDGGGLDDEEERAGLAGPQQPRKPAGVDACPRCCCDGHDEDDDDGEEEAGGKVKRGGEMGGQPGGARRGRRADTSGKRGRDDAVASGVKQASGEQGRGAEEAGGEVKRGIKGRRRAQGAADGIGGDESVSTGGKDSLVVGSGEERGAGEEARKGGPGKRGKGCAGKGGKMGSAKADDAGAVEAEEKERVAVAGTPTVGKKRGRGGAWVKEGGDDVVAPPHKQAQALKIGGATRATDKKKPRRKTVAKSSTVTVKAEEVEVEADKKGSADHLRRLHAKARLILSASAARQATAAGIKDEADVKEEERGAGLGPEAEGGAAGFGTEVAEAEATGKKAGKQRAMEKKPAKEPEDVGACLRERRDVTLGGPAARKFAGAHTSAAAGVYNAVLNATRMGARAFALFVRSRGTWNCAPMDEEAADLFKEAMRVFGYSPDHVVPHGSYLLNCGSGDRELLARSRAGMLDEVTRCERLGLTLYNIHPGTTGGLCDLATCIRTIAESIGYVHERTRGVTILVENMCGHGQGRAVGGRFEDLRDIIALVKDKTRVGVCFDTCHAFAAGYDISTVAGFERVLAEFDDVIGLAYLKAVHLNDSKKPLGSRLDRHEKIGRGEIGAEAFRFIMRDPRFDGIPLTLETPCEDEKGAIGQYRDEIGLLYSFANEEEGMPWSK
eukprot:jgi/Mesvir1/14831/Mv05457-RA.1